MYMNTTHFCCQEMEQSITETGTIRYNDVFDEYGIPVPEDGGASSLLIKFCPWCGKQLPESKRYEWFEKLENLGFDNPLSDDTIPSEFKSSEWRKVK